MMARWRAHWKKRRKKWELETLNCFLHYTAPLCVPEKNVFLKYYQTLFFYDGNTQKILTRKDILISREREVFFKFFKIEEKENIFLTRLDLGMIACSSSTYMHVAKLKNMSAVFICTPKIYYLDYLAIKKSFFQIILIWNYELFVGSFLLAYINYYYSDVDFFQLHLCLFVNLERITAHATHQIVGFLHINPSISQQQRDDCMFSGLK